MLAREPYRLAPAEIGALTPYQVRHLYLARPERATRGQQSYREIFFAVWRRRGLSDARIEEKWRQRLQEEKR